MKKIYLLAALLGCLAVPILVGAQRLVDTPVTSSIEGLGISTSPTLRIQSDQLGPYKNSKSLQSIIQGIGDWVLDMLNFNSSPQRMILVDLRDPVAGSGPNGGAPINPLGSNGYQMVRARFLAQCSGTGINMLNMQPNVSYFCPLTLGFDANGARYRLAQNPTNFAETNWVQVTCLGKDSNGRCSQWKFEPSVTQADGERKNVAKLLKVATTNKQTDQDYGDYYLSFTIDVTNP